MAGSGSSIDLPVLGSTAAVGLAAGVGGGLVCGADASQLAIGAIIGLAIGLLGGLGIGSLTERRITVAGRSAALGPEPTPRTDRAGAPERTSSPAGINAPPPGHLDELVTAIGRRHQSLADRQLAALLALGEDPSRTEELAVSTRLARRIRRAGRTLLVLAQDSTSQETSERTSIVSVIEMAIADNDHQGRIDYQSVHNAALNGEVVPDLVHLLAELIDNAVTASAHNQTKVVVLGRRSSDGYLLSVVDEGGGIGDPDRHSANSVLEAPPALASQPTGSFGLATVGRLAARHGVGVALLEAATDGVIAKVRLPAALLDGPRGKSRRDRQPEAPERAVDGEVIDLTGTAAQPASGGESTPAAEPAGARPTSTDRLRQSLAGFSVTEAAVDAETATVTGTAATDPGEAGGPESPPDADPASALQRRRPNKAAPVGPVRRDHVEPAAQLARNGERVRQEMGRAKADLAGETGEAKP